MHHSSAIRVLAASLLLENGRPTVLSLAALPTKATESFLVIIPLK